MMSQRTFLKPVLLFALITSLVYFGVLKLYAAQVGAGDPSTTASTNDATLTCADNAWASVTSSKTQDDSYDSITHATYDANDISERLDQTDFASTTDLPYSASPTGIKVEIDRYKSAGAARDSRVHLIIDGSVNTAVNKALTAAWATSDTDAYQTYGQDGDLWAATSSLTAAIIRQTNFGTTLCVLATAANTDVNVDHMRLTVFYALPSHTQSAYRWFENSDSANVGATTTMAQDQPATTTAQAQAFRLRTLVDIATATSTANEDAFRLQFAEKSGTCDTAFSGESYATVTSATAIAFYDNPSVSATTSLISNSNDPTHLGHTIVNQLYQEENPATTTTDVAAGRDSKWDWSLYDNDGAASKNYCFRMIKDSGQLFSTYSVIPELTTFSASISAAYNQVFDYQGATTSPTTLTITDTAGGAITDRYDLRVAIATSSVNMRFDTSSTTIAIGGAAASKVSSSVSYEGGGSVMVIPVNTDFVTNDALTVSYYKPTSFNTATSATAGAIGIFTGGANDTTFEATTTQTVAIRGIVTLGNHSLGQITDQWTTDSATTTVHYRHKLTPTGEDAAVGTTTFTLSAITGVDNTNISYARLYFDSNSNGRVSTSSNVVAYLRPNATGTYTGLTATGAACLSQNWSCVDEDSSDDETTYNSATAVLRETYHLANSTTTGPISKVKLTNRLRDDNSLATFRNYILFKGVIYQDLATTTLTSTYTDYSSQWTTNPASGRPWRWDDLDNLEAGGIFSGGGANPLRLTQTWIEVTYCDSSLYDCPVGGPGSGTVDISGTSGTIQFATSTNYAATTSAPFDYILELAMTGLAPGDTITISLTNDNVSSTTGYTSNLTASSTGNASSVTHTMDSAGASPTISNAKLNYGNNITLTEGTFVWATTTFLVTDTDGCGTISTVVATAYLASTSNRGTTCSANDNNCYPDDLYNACLATTTGNQCTGDTDADYDCGFKFWNIAESTGGAGAEWDSSLWSVSATATDNLGSTGNATNTSQLVEVLALVALDVTNSIAYGSLNIGDTNNPNATTTATTTGNVAINTQVKANNDMCIGACGAANWILSTRQRYSTTPGFAYLDGTTLSSTTAQTVVLSNANPTSTTSPENDDVYWRINIPTGTGNGAYTGQTTFTAVSD